MTRCLLTAAVILLLAGCTLNPFAVETGVSLPEHSHAVQVGDNEVEHEPEGYCGNTITTVRCEKPGKQEERWERTFMGGTSVGLTDFLRWLDFSEDICRCLPEYYVDTELSEAEYGISLTGGYVRHEGKQCQLTEEQVAWLTRTVETLAAGTVDGLLCIDPAERPVFGE